MKNNTQFERYQRLLSFLEKRFTSTIATKEIEDVSFYSYRNINRIFLALQQETIGQFLKRRKLEKAAEYLKYSEAEISDIALDIGYSDIAAFSKAFKKQFRCAPSTFRNSFAIQQKITREVMQLKEPKEKNIVDYTIETLPSFQILFLPFQGAYENIQGIEKTWSQLISYANHHNLLKENTVLLGEILDDDEITASIHCRYNAGITLPENSSFRPKGKFDIKTIPSLKYAKFIHNGSHETCHETYHNIYARWLFDIPLEFADHPILEFYPNDNSHTSKEELRTEIYIPVS